MVESCEGVELKPGDVVEIIHRPLGVTGGEDFVGQVGVVEVGGVDSCGVRAHRRGFPEREEVWCYQNKFLALQRQACSAGDDKGISEFIESF